MGILDDFKKLFWANKAVAKSAAKKAGHEVKEAAEEGYEKLKDLSEKVADKVGDAFDDVKDYTSDVMQKPWVNKPSETTEPTDQNATSETSSPPPPQDKPTAKKVVDEAVKMSDKVWEKAEDVGEKAWEKAGEMTEKAKDVAKKVGKRIDEKLDEMVEKAKELDKKIEAEKDAVDKDRDGYADKPVNEKLREEGSLLKDKDDFWSKAEQYAEGDYTMGKPTVVGKEDPAPSDDKLDLKPLKGFKDNDGDGDSLVDDAEIVDDDDDGGDDDKKK